MTKLPAVPEASSRESPAFWLKMISASNKRRERSLRDFEEFSRWHRGDLSGVIDPQASSDGYRWQYGLENMTNLATVASMADLLFRWPRFVCRPPYSATSPLFLPALARCETTYLAHTLRRVNYLSKARRALQDALLGGMGILKVTADNEITVDRDAIEAAELEARNEIENFILRSVKMIAKDDQLHSVHVQIKREVVAQAERGEIALPRSAIKYIKAHIRHHETMKESERPTETVRTSQIRIRRVNPLDYTWDPTADDRDDASWKACKYLMRKADVVTNNDFDPQARIMVGATTDRWVSQRHQPSVKTPGSYDISEDMVLVHEVFDFVDQKRRVFVDGVPLMLIPDEDRGALADIQPSGPFHEIVFVEDTSESHGVSPVSSFAGEQAAATHIASANVAGAVESRPRMLINKRDLPADQAILIQESRAGAVILVDPKGDVTKKIEDMFAQVPAVDIPAQNVGIKNDMIHGIERRSGLGAGKMMGGETEPTATGAALGADASNSIAEDRGALVDAWAADTARAVCRLGRAFVPKAMVVAVCGEEAIEAWPDKWAFEDIRNDIGIDVVAGSARRRNTAVDQKQLSDGIAAFTADPAMQGPTAVKMRTDMYEMYFEDAGITGLDWRAVREEAALMAQMQQQQLRMQAMQQAMMMQQAGGAPGEAQEGAPDAEGAPGTPEGAEAPTTPPNASSPNATGATSPNDLAQGVANVGGGRVATGASVGDKIRVMRSGAKERIKDRG